MEEPGLVGVQGGELQVLKESLADTQPIGHLVGCCRTLDQASFVTVCALSSFHVCTHSTPIPSLCCLQAKALLKIVEGISEQSLSSTVAVTASRGRGKSATLGLALAAAVAFG